LRYRAFNTYNYRFRISIIHVINRCFMSVRKTETMFIGTRDKVAIEVTMTGRVNIHLISSV